jgi:hypothetical protein
MNFDVASFRFRKSKSRNLSGAFVLDPLIAGGTFGRQKKGVDIVDISIQTV